MKISRDNIRGLSGVLLAFAVIGLLDFARPAASSAPDFSCDDSGQSEVIISISSGESGSSIAQALANLGVVKSSEAFFRVAVSDPRSASIAPGNHRVSKGICAQLALNQLLDSDRITNLLAINEGEWISEIKIKMEKAGFLRSDIESALKSVTLPVGYTSLEGLLFPAHYSFDSRTAISTVLTTLIGRSQKEIAKAGIDREVGGFTPQQLLIIASLVQAEGDPDDYRRISQVVRNRLEIGMPLQFDSTVHYIKGTRGSVFLSTKSTFINSPYNTYRRYGLPPGPINNPGAAAMKAAANPTPGDWLFFITVSPGDTRFTSKIEEFNSWKVLYKKNLAAGKFESTK
jgi:UPF0755 protein